MSPAMKLLAPLSVPRRIVSARELDTLGWFWAAQERTQRRPTVLHAPIQPLPAILPHDVLEPCVVLPIKLFPELQPFVVGRPASRLKVGSEDRVVAPSDPEPFGFKQTLEPVRPAAGDWQQGRPDTADPGFVVGAPVEDDFGVRVGGEQFRPEDGAGDVGDGVAVPDHAVERGRSK